jgi:hypothetical protein
MAKSQSPLFGIDASGAIGDTVVYGKWKGIKYARRYVVPANPRTAEQMKTRDVFSFLNQLWVVAPSLLKEPFAAYASGKPLTDRNAFIQQNIPNLREATDLSAFVASPGVMGGFPLTSLTATPGTDSVTAEAGVPSLPSGWTVDHVAFIILSDQDPHEGWAGVILAQSDTTAPYSVTFTDLSEGDYRVTAYARYTRPDGKQAYSPSRIVGVTVS